MTKTLFLGIIGVGGVGNAFLEQLGRLPTPPKLILLARSSQSLLAPSPGYSPSIPITSWNKATEKESLIKCGALTPVEMVEYLGRAPGPTIVVDNTSDLALAQAYPLFLRKGISIVTPNKKGFSQDLGLWDDIFAAATEGNALVYHQGTVGGTLPVLSTLRDLIATGDEIIGIEAVLSGTLSQLLGTYMPASGTSTESWSSLVARAREAGETEPDPRDDLDGLDFARKLTIIARIIGLRVTGADEILVESLIPVELRSLPSSSEGVEQFMNQLPQFDSRMDEAKEAAQKQDKVLRYVGSIDVPTKTIKVGLHQVDKNSRIAGLVGTKFVSMYTKRYKETPLVLQGGGGGGEITASGLMADLLKVMERLG
ncbi:homoserine dehydrogenase [Penicillium waksmanii]|uniref:homoserine dehydrogenase n=1 Tax=Penicillium waksmanii TaxID=69791 RepID=UPI0025467E8E|nr:homoserine dehydrogenase [Penicillium waksmanii]KAJ5984033.1 homoserine dehydrogenase [Penicillium waksmanii]